MNLVIDVGNTRTKFALFQDNNILEEGLGPESLVVLLKNLKQDNISPDIIISTSGNIDPRILQVFKEYNLHYYVLSHSLPLPINNAYETPETLGMDRISGAIGANYLFPNTDLLIIDSGTAITYDYVSSEGTFLGGNISPGIAMRFMALHNFTAKLPFIEVPEKFGQVGKNTRDAIINGVMQGVLHEINGYIEEFYINNPKGKILTTGGYSEYILSHIKTPVNHISELIFIGLNIILDYQKTVNI